MISRHHKTKAIFGYRHIAIVVKKKEIDLLQRARVEVFFLYHLPSRSSCVVSPLRVWLIYGLAF
jgi:hypothetical protein